jgi:hypothetical protein
MGLPENPTVQAENQEAGRRRVARRPRMRRCLHKGCERRFRPRQARQRYCSGECRKEARRWSRWKAQQQYRATAAGQQKRNRQSVRYRERVRNPKPPPPEAVNEPARVITPAEFFRRFVRPAGLLRKVRARTAKSLATLLFVRVPAGAGARLRARAALAGGARLNPEILIRPTRFAYIQPV